MDGLTFLEKLMRGHPMPVVMISSLTDRGAETTLRALSLGAVDYIAKPKLDVSSGTIEQAERHHRQGQGRRQGEECADSTHGETVPAALPAGFHITATHKVVAIGASTGAPRRSRIC